MELSSLLGDLDLARSDEEKRRKEKIHSRVLRGKRNSHGDEVGSFLKGPRAA